MKEGILYRYVILSLILLLTACSKETTPYIGLDSTTAEVAFTADDSESISFSSATSWTAKVDDGCDWLKVSPSSGGGSEAQQTLSITSLSANSTNGARSATITISSGNITKVITVNQSPAFIIEKLEYSIGAEGGTIRISFDCESEDPNKEVTFNVFDSESNKEVNKLFDTSKETISTKLYSASFSRAYKSYYIDVEIEGNSYGIQRQGKFYFKYKGVSSSIITVTQAGKNVGESTDLSTNDGNVKQLLTHSKGGGIPVVLMGDGFLDTDISGGTYDEAMNKALGYLFSVEPTKSFKEYFDVYSVSAVSKNNIFLSGYSTAFSCSLNPSVSTAIEGDDDKVLSYAKKIGIDNTKLMNDALIIVVLNTTDYAGTCSIYMDDTVQEIPNSYSIAYVPMTDGSIYGGIGFEQILHHEAIGHGFGKLEDEYSYEENGTIPSSELKSIVTQQSYGLWRNVDSHSDVAQTLWAGLAANSNYANEGLGAFEGACTYIKGIYRPTRTSIMVDNSGAFNAPSREAIYKRIMNIANNHVYTYAKSDFLKYDAINLSSGKALSTYSSRSSNIKPLGRPRVKYILR